MVQVAKDVFWAGLSFALLPQVIKDVFWAGLSFALLPQVVMDVVWACLSSALLPRVAKDVVWACLFSASFPRLAVMVSPSQRVGSLQGALGQNCVLQQAATMQRKSRRCNVTLVAMVIQ